jgi:hypothetical protein
MTLRLDEARLLPALDPDNRSAWLALGATAENAFLALEQVGLEGNCAVSETVTLTWTPRSGPAPSPRLYQMVPLRRTSRVPFGPAEAPAAEGVIWLTGPACVEELRHLVLREAMDELTDPARARELYRWTRYTPGHPNWHRDGLTGDALGLRRWEAWLTSWAAWPILPVWLRRLLLGGLDTHAPPAPLWGLLLCDTASPLGWFTAGRRLQRLWLSATAAGLSLQPLRVSLPEAARLFGADGPVAQLFRMGTSPCVPASPRLPADELIESLA